jgi:hypothetical protein
LPERRDIVNYILEEKSNMSPRGAVVAEETPVVVLCPYCGHTQRLPAERCDDCGGYFDGLSRRVSQQHMGPWYIRNSKQPFCPGCSYDVLLRQIQRGKITPNTIMRGPTTKQFWSVARNVPGVAHHLGLCHNCNGPVSPEAKECSRCGAHFVEPRKRNKLGLDPDDPTVFEEVRLAGGAKDNACIPPTPQPGNAEASGSVAPARAKVVSTTSFGPMTSSSSASSSSGAGMVVTPKPNPVRAQVPPQPVADEEVESPAMPVQQDVNWIADGGDQQGEDVQEVVVARGSHLWVWVLVALNVALLAAVVFFIFFGGSDVTPVRT